MDSNWTENKTEETLKIKKQNAQTFSLQLLELKLKWGETIKPLNGDSTV